MHSDDGCSIPPQYTLPPPTHPLLPCSPPPHTPTHSYPAYAGREPCSLPPPPLLLPCPAYAGRRHRTVIHGDFKSENVLFSADGRNCAAYDFQYCGDGCGGLGGLGGGAEGRGGGMFVDEWVRCVSVCVGVGVGGGSMFLEEWVRGF